MERKGWGLGASAVMVKVKSSGEGGWVHGSVVNGEQVGVAPKPLDNGRYWAIMELVVRYRVTVLTILPDKVDLQKALSIC